MLLRTNQEKVLKSNLIKVTGEYLRMGTFTEDKWRRTTEVVGGVKVSGVGMS